MTPPRMNVTYFGLGVRRDDAVERDRVGDDRTIQAQQPGMVVTGVFRLGSTPGNTCQMG